MTSLTDAAWLDEAQAIDELLDALLHWGETKGCSWETPTDRSADEEPASAEEASTSQPPPRKRIRTSRPREQLLALRRSADGLSKQLEVLQRRRQPRQSSAPRAELAGATNDVDSRLARIWKSVALRQHNYLREAQQENEKLKSQVEMRVQLMTNLARALRRAHQTPLTIPRCIQPSDAALFERQRHELYMKVTAMSYQAKAFAAQCALRSPMPGATKHSFTKEATASHPLLGSSIASQAVPLPFNEVCDGIWTHNQNEKLPSSLYQAETIERTVHTELTKLSIAFNTRVGSAELRGLALRHRFQEPSRDVVVSVGMMWASPSTPAPFSAANFELRMWSIVQPHSSQTNTSNPANEVLIKIETWRIPPLHTEYRHKLAAGETKMLRLIVERQHEHNLTQLQRQLDAMLLGERKHCSLPS